jgi:predicted secreted protein
MSAVKLGLGTLLKRGSTTIPELTNIAINPARDSIDVTNHDSTAPAREFIAGLLDGGEVTFDGNFLPGSSNQKLLTTDLFGAAGTVTAWSIVWIDGPTTWTFNAFVKGFSPTGTVGDKLSFSGSLKVTGTVVIS